MSVEIDRPRDIRSGEELDTAKLTEYLRGHLPGLKGEIEVAQFPSGYSNLTYMLREGDQEFVLRRPPFGSKVKSAHDMGREHRVLSALHPIFPAAPKPLVYCDDDAVIGAPFYVMERIRGVILRGKRPEGFAPDEATVRECCRSLVRNLADLHALDYEAAGLGDLRKDGSYVERQANGWIKRYFGSQTDDIPSIQETANWLADNLPADTGAVLVHNDYKFDNVVLDADDITKIVGVLDWEMCTIGDPLMDLGTTIGYWMEAGDPRMGDVMQFMTMEPGALTRREVAEYYAELTGRDISNILFYYVFALFKLAVIVQQIYYRYKQGLTNDERFGKLIFMVGALGMRSTECIASGKF
ncbi:MAG: phosphotransferase [Candidatus Hydrogenedens sp.]|nr:phosphotransferase [Candidatus Hydrogenedens sp.]